MENNEDNRHMTVIAAEIERQKIELEKHRSLTNILNHATLQLQSMKRVVECDYAISVLESLLPKEKEQMKAAFKYGEANIMTGEGKLSVNWFNETFKTT